MRIIKLLVLFLIFIVLASCEYEPHGIYDAKIPEPEPFDLTISLDNTSSSFNVFFPTTFKYSVDLRGRKLYEIQYFLNDNLIHTNDVASGSFGIDPIDYSIGTYQLTMKVITNTESGSLADNTGNEAFIFNSEWEIHIDGQPPNQIDVLGTENVNGRLVIAWNKYDRKNFQKYEIYKVLKGQYHPTYHLLAEIEDSDVSSIIDSTYIGEDVEYQIRITASDYNVSGDLYQVNYGLPEIIESEVISNSITFKISKCKFPANFDSYKLFDTKHSDEIEVASISSIEDTLIRLDNVSFGRERNFELRTFPKKNYTLNSYDEYSVHKTFIGERTPMNGYYKMNVTTGAEFMYPCKVFPWNNVCIYRYSNEDNQIIDSVLLKISRVNISKNSQYLVGIAWNSEDKLYKINPLDLSDYDELSNEEILGDRTNYFKYISVSNDGIAALSCTKTFVLYDFNTNQIVYQDSIRRYEAEISSDSKYIVCKLHFNERTFYKYDLGSVEYINTIYAPSYMYGFNPKDPSEYYYASLNPDVNLVFVDCETATPKRSYEINSGFVSSIDPITDNILVESINQPDNYYTQYDVMNIYSGKITKTFSADQQGYYIVNSNLYSSSGFRLNLEL